MKRDKQDRCDQIQFALNDEQWEAFTAMLDRPAVDRPRLRRLFEEPHIAKRQDAASR